MKAVVVVRANQGARPDGFDQVLRALADLVDLRADAPSDSPEVSWTGDAIIATDATGLRHEVPLPPMLVDLDHSPPMAPFVRARARRLRGLPDALVVEAGDPRTAVASRVTAHATARRADVVRALATGAIVVGPNLADDPVLAEAPHLRADRPLDAADAATLSRRAARFARRRFDPRSIALQVVEALGLPVTSVRHALTELHRGELSRVDARAARLTAQEVVAWP